MIDNNNNHKVDENVASEANKRLKDWLHKHTDPNKNPWSDDDIICDNSETEEDCVYIDPTIDREDDDDCKLLLGSRNEDGRLDGNVSLSWSNGDSFKGCYEAGVRSGWGGVVMWRDAEIITSTPLKIEACLRTNASNRWPRMPRC